MKVVLIAAAIVAASGAAQAAEIPAFTVTCKKTTVSAVAGGPVKIGKKDAKITAEKDNSFDAVRGGMTVTVTVNADKTVAATYAKKKNNEKGACIAKA